MPAPLPSALRARFEEYIAEGLSARAAAARLKLSAATGVRWKRKLRETGAIEPAPRGRAKGHGKLAPHQAFLEELVAHDGDITLPELAGALEVATGVVAHAASIGRFVRKLGYTYKKITAGSRKASCTCQAPPTGMVQTPNARYASPACKTCVHRRDLAQNQPDPVTRPLPSW